MSLRLSLNPVVNSNAVVVATMATENENANPMEGNTANFRHIHKSTAVNNSNNAVSLLPKQPHWWKVCWLYGDQNRSTNMYRTLQMGGKRRSAPVFSSGSLKRGMTRFLSTGGNNIGGTFPLSESVTDDEFVNTKKVEEHIIDVELENEGSKELNEFGLRYS